MSVRSKTLGSIMMAQYDLKWKRLALFYSDQTIMLLNAKELRAIKRLTGPFGWLFCNRGKDKHVSPWVILDENGALAGIKPYKESDTIG